MEEVHSDLDMSWTPSIGFRTRMRREGVSWEAAGGGSQPELWSVSVASADGQGQATETEK